MQNHVFLFTIINILLYDYWQKGMTPFSFFVALAYKRIVDVSLLWGGPLLYKYSIYYDIFIN